MKKLTLSGLSLALLIMLTWAITGQTQSRQNAATAVQQQKCESPFYTRRPAPGEENRLANDPVVKNFQVTESINPSALADVVKSGDKSLVPYLEYRADVFSDPSALLTLVKLGDETRFNKLVNQARCVEGEFDGSDYTRQRQAIQLLALLKTPAAYRALYNLLDDTTMPQTETGVVFLTRSQMAAMQLAGTVNPRLPELDLPNGAAKSDGERAVIWKKWLETNNFVK